jgi:hypothetical protein
MTRVIVTPAILGILVTATVAGTLPAGCTSNKSGLGQLKADAQAPGLDAPAGGGSAAGAVSDAVVVGGATGNGGVTSTGGITQTGGSTSTGGSTQTGGSTGAGGATLTGGSTGAGGATLAGGSTESGGATQTGGATLTGGSTGAGGATLAGGSTESGGATQTGGAKGTAGTKSSTGGSGGTTCTGSGCLQVDAGCTGSGCSKDAGNSDAAGSCGQVTTRTECDGRNDCHSVFVDPGNCGCAALGCCAKFSRCADGASAKCSGIAMCELAPPRCEGSFVRSYTSNCWEGCVSQDKCAGADAGVTPPTCPETAPANASSCGSASLTCFYDNCPSGGRTQAVCAGGNWTVETAACGTVTCDPDPSGSARTCSSGQICVVVNSGASSYACMSNTCNISLVPQGPVSTQCTGMSTCSMHYSLTHGVTFICPTYVCPPFCA